MLLFLTSYTNFGIKFVMKIYKLILLACIASNLVIAFTADAAICTANNKAGILQCFDKEQDRIEKEMRKSEEELLAYCQKTVGETECSALSERINARHKTMSAYKTYLDSLDSVKKGLIDLGRAANNTLQQQSKDLDDFLNSLQ